MKKLLDETTDDLTRALLEAGARQRPPAGSRRKLLVALGASTAVGLFSSKALAWFGTGLGKWTTLAVTVGAVGTIYALTPGQGTGALGVQAPRQTDASRESVAPALSLVDASRAELAVPEAAISATQRADVDVSRTGSAERVSARLPRKSSAPAKAAFAGVERFEGKPAERAGLDSEVRLVDALRSATLRKDWPAARQLIDRYRRTFPEGQLDREVTELAAVVVAALP